MKVFSRQLEENLGLTPSSVNVSMESSPSQKTKLKSNKGQTLNQWSIKKNFTMIAVFAFTISTMNAQIKLTYSGNVGMGIDPTWVGCKLRVAYGGNDFTFFPSLENRIFFGGYNAHASTTRIEFWHPNSSWNKIRINGYDLASDSTLKTDIMPIENATDILKQIKTYSFYFKKDCQETRKRDYGVLAQELEEVLPELIDTSMGTMFVNYNAFIGILIAGVNEQQNTIETQEERIEQQQNEIRVLQQIAWGQEFDITELYELRDRVEKMQNTIKEMQEAILICCKGDITFTRQDTNLFGNNKNGIQSQTVLYQNIPNPFSSNTEISCDIPTPFSSAFIYIYNLQGIELMSFPVVQTGFNTVMVYASALPAGMYLYSLVVDNVIIDSKRMILTK